MMRKLQYKFVAISTAAVIIVMCTLLSLINFMFSQNALEGISGALHSIAENGGELPQDYGTTKLRGYGAVVAEIRFQLRYFTVWVEKDNETIKSTNLSHIHAVSEDEAAAYARKILAKGKEEGRIQGDQANFFYLVREEDEDKMVVLMDYSREFESIEHLRQFSFRISLACLGFFVLVVSFLSRRAITPIIRNMENQERFITNAGHELKTPMAIISANTEVLEMTEGENEWTRSTMEQVQRLTGLVNNLITLARMGEQKDEKVTDIDLSSCVSKVVSDFGPVADRQHIRLDHQILPDLKVRGMESHIRELVNILCDNAVKYCDQDGQVIIKLKKRPRHKGTILAVSNTFAEGKDVDYSRFFERFYRGDASHNSQKSGYGIGLAMAEGFVRECKGKIQVRYDDGVITFIVTFP